MYLCCHVHFIIRPSFCARLAVLAISSENDEKKNFIMYHYRVHDEIPTLDRSATIFAPFCSPSLAESIDTQFVRVQSLGT